MPKQSQESPIFVNDRFALTDVYQKLGGTEYGMSTSAPLPRFPNRLYLGSVGTAKPGIRRILVYEASGDGFKRLDDFEYDEKAGGGIYQAERDGESINYYSGMDHKLRLKRKIKEGS